VPFFRSRKRGGKKEKKEGGTTVASVGCRSRTDQDGGKKKYPMRLRILSFSCRFARRRGRGEMEGASPEKSVAYVRSLLPLLTFAEKRKKKGRKRRRRGKVAAPSTRRRAARNRPPESVPW